MSRHKRKNVELLIHSSPEPNGDLNRRRDIVLRIKYGYPGIANEKAKQNFDLLMSPEDAEELANDLNEIAEHVKSRDVVKA
jgi:hypothetical protein